MEKYETSLKKLHESLDAHMVDFNGWLMPIYYASILKEHETVRKRAGIFDASHMGEILVEGADSTPFLNHLLCNNIDVDVGQCVYTPMCVEDGGIVDDLIVYRLSKDGYMLVVNAGNTEKDLEWIIKNIVEDVKVSDISSETSLIALQGPESDEILGRTSDYDIENLNRFRLSEEVDINGVPALVSRTGYTGENGFEIYVKWGDGPKVWESLMNAGALPCGLGARDTLRLEMGYALYGHEINLETTPLEAGLSWTCDFSKDFIGKKVMEKQKDAGVEKKLVGFKCLEKAIPRESYEIMVDEVDVGFVTSGTMSPTLKQGVGMGYVKPGYAKLGGEIEIMVRSKSVKAEIVKTPFVKTKK